MTESTDSASVENGISPVTSQPGGAAGTYVTVFFTGAAVLILEILGTRMLTPFFGNNVYVWSALISVTMVALAAGYWAGGRLADRAGSGATLDAVIAGAAIWAAAIPSAAKLVAGLTAGLPYEAGLLATATLAFGPALAMLGMVTTLAVRLNARDLTRVGRAAGGVYAWSTVGSVAGALGAGFVLFPLIPVSRVCYLTALALFGLAVVRRLGRRRPAAGLALLLAVGLAGFVAAGAEAPARGRGSFSVVADQPSFYGTVRVVESRDSRYLMIDGMCHSAQGARDRRPLLAYVQALGAIPYLRPEGRDVLLIGLGGGDLVRLWAEHGIRTRAVEIDPFVARAAFEHFGLRADPSSVVISDGRAYVRRSRERFDFIVIDAFCGGIPPSHLFTREALLEMKRRLRPRGLVGVNAIVLGHESRLVGDLIATMSSVFPELLVAATEKDGARLGNVILFASHAPLAWPAAWNPAPRDRHVASLLQSLPALTIDHRRRPGRVITDDWNPLERATARAEIAMRLDARRILPRALLEP